ncbi:MAG: tRNA (adenosine(37)-N6)-dimethylallyltransferase MiaA [Candidatus Omnitrophota bacterium]|jgi:tRNA dimethylallyltransferase|nr:MAG: tRNA (adenosine(37)-N6)-dimethylallyltransferase MiaA [Candidatus Omnitrophota bacterium]
MEKNRSSRKDVKEKIFFLVGPTATGKSKVAIILAKKLKAEIVSCDSMQVYKGLDIVTSKPALADRRKISHHLIDVISPKEQYDVSRYRRNAMNAIGKILRKHKTPLFVGGTGLYMSVVIDGIFKHKSGNSRIRAKLYREASHKGSTQLFERLVRVDPEASARIHPHDLRRIVRALEVFEATGQPISKLQKQREGLAGKYEVACVCLDMEKPALYRRIEQRVDHMFKAGLVEEVKKLSRGALSKTASLALGIREVQGYLKGLYGLDEAKQLLKRNTRLYAKRQLTWFRKDKRIKWIKITAGDSAYGIAGKVIKLLRNICKKKRC